MAQGARRSTWHGFFQAFEQGFKALLSPSAQRVALAFRLSHRFRVAEQRLEPFSIGEIRERQVRAHFPGSACLTASWLRKRAEQRRKQVLGIGVRAETPNQIRHHPRDSIMGDPQPAGERGVSSAPPPVSKLKGVSCRGNIDLLNEAAALGQVLELRRNSTDWSEGIERFERGADSRQLAFDASEFRIVGGATG